MGIITLMVTPVKRLWMAVTSALYILVATSSPILMGSALAATPPAVSTLGQGIEISPPVIELKADPGQSVVATIRLRNITKNDLLAKGKADDFGAKGEDGQPQILLDEKDATPYSLKFWIESVPNLRLSPQKIETVSIKINVPKNAEPGGHYGVVRFTALPPELEGISGVALSASIGTLILLNVSGDVKNSAKYVDFYVGKQSKDGAIKKSGFYEYGPISFVERIQNDGNVHVKPIGNVEVFDIFGRKIDSIAVNDPPRNILPASTRRFDQSWTKRWLLGRYRAVANLSYDGKTLQTKEIFFWVIPYRMLLALLAAAIVLVWLLRKGLKSYNQYVIRQARKQNR